MASKASLSFAQSAVDDLGEIREWYNDQDVPEVGTRLVGELFTHIQKLADNPKIGRVVPEFNQPLLRELIHPPFRIVYRHDPGRVRIVRVWRSERMLKLPTDS